ncbi:S8 family peptidase [Anoxybacillus flavithermus]|uniref:S8 family peptidase n=1 Tax=Anoxybacillus flavithermus TaxID=33934 RepID=UPI0018663F2D|nr:S8 family serine peptidase [Anoxybacillus flavithermus]MBE2926251.1 S8 family serine peptidase [Anoxybacillus flavithermus]MBE2937296.1 S8 family serine peptidase [Anoxybacillus flavithermus]MBE2944875.1 S8 family serine peptidase [Anoxybacillus flavithermus]MBE2947863.1 S8 family serine peptidase [Anoxybacillus flavithermus]
MKKWKKTALSISLASSLIVPTFAQASTEAPIAQWKKQTTTASASLAYKKFEDAQNQVSTDTLIVKYNKKIPTAVHRSLGATLKQSFPQLGYDVVTVKKGKSLQEVMRNYAKLKAVKSVTPSFTYKRLGSLDPKADHMYLLSLLNVDKAIKLAGKHSVTVAVIDTGMDTKHPELKGHLLPAYNAMNPAGAPIKDVHGTHVAGIIGANANNGVGAHGVNPNVKILPIDVFGGGLGANDYTIAQGILYAIEKGAKVINMSLGGYSSSPILEEAVQKAIDAGITVVAAAGNDATDMYSTPAAYEGVISVGATDSKNKLAEFSNYGPSVDLVAPGADVYSPIYDHAKGSSFAELSGTSMASPVVAGVASLLLSKYPNLKPYQVEWILERTATDLGEKGYDLTYGNGLVNPVAALQYNIKNVPQQEKWNDETILAKAPVIDAKELYVKQGSFTKPEEMHWVKVNVQQGESVQALLEGAETYDYKLVFRFYPEGKTTSEKPIQVNDGRAGEMEAKLFTAKQPGVLAIGVTDANGNYNLQGKSTYTLAVQSFTELADDGLTKENPATIEQLPFSLENLTFVPENNESDRDYFQFTVAEPTTVKFQLSPVPGIDSSLHVYVAEDLYRPVDPDAKYEEIPFPIASGNNNGVGKGETMTFEAQPGVEYVLEASSEPMDGFYPMVPDMAMSSNKVKEATASAIPYQISAEAITLPQDEDSLPAREPMSSEEGAVEQAKKAAVNMRKPDDIITIGDDGSWSYFENKQVAQIKENALPYNIGDRAEAFIQFSYDQDFYKLTVPKTAIYQFSFATPDDMMPSAVLFEYDEKKDDLVPVNPFYPFDSMTGKKQSDWTLILEEGKTYYMSVQNDYYRPVADPYVITSKKLLDAPTDKNEKNNEPIQATVMNVNDVKKGNLVLPNDSDYYYYKHQKATELLTFYAKPSKQNASLPKALRGTLIPIVSVVEDTNGNMTIDEDEYNKAVPFYPNDRSPLYDVNGSFRAKKNVGYFFIVNPLMRDGLLLQSYNFGIQSLNKKDEDASSVMKNNVPSKPLSLNKKGNTYEAKGYMNVVDYGDKDAYKFVVAKDGTFTFKLDVPGTMDGVISIFDAKGRVVQTYDYYGDGDAEIGTLSLKKGTYYVVVEESLARPNANPYTLSIIKNR